MNKINLFVCIALLFGSCSTNTLPEGENYLDVKGGKIWYKVVGKGDKTPIVMVHGGPGFPGYYLTPLFELAKDRQLIIYDQLGCGRSGKLEDTSFMNIGSQRDDLQALIDKLGIRTYYLYGHSYGSALAFEYYLKSKVPPQAMILASPCLSVQRWQQDADTLIASMDSVYRKPLENFKAGKKVDSIAYARAIDKYYGSFYNMVMNRYLDSSIANNGQKLYLHMWGKEEFMATGNLKQYDRVQELSRVNIPVLFTCGEFDAARPATVKYYQSLTPHSRFILIKNAAHSTMNDNPSGDINAIREFLRSVEQ